jgi:hypothetical protein
MKNKKRILKNKNKNIFYKKKRIMKGGQEQEEEEVENENKINHSGLLGVLEQASSIFKMGANIVVNKATKMLDLDLSKLNESSSSLSNDQLKQILKEKIDQLNELLEDPEVQEQLTELARTIGEKGGVIIEAASPPIKKALFKLIEIVTSGGIKLGQSMVKIILDVAGTVPIMGEVIEGIRVLDDIVKAFQATQVAYLEAYIANMDTITETIRRYKELFNKSTNMGTTSNSSSENKNDEPQTGGASIVKKRITNSINKFNKTNKVRRRLKKQTRKRKTRSYR